VLGCQVFIIYWYWLCFSGQSVMISVSIAGQIHCRCFSLRIICRAVACPLPLLLPSADVYCSHSLVFSALAVGIPLATASHIVMGQSEAREQHHVTSAFMLFRVLVTSANALLCKQTLSGSFGVLRGFGMGINVCNGKTPENCATSRQHKYSNRLGAVLTPSCHGCIAYFGT